LIFKRAAGVGAPARKDTPMLRVVTDKSTGGELASTTTAGKQAQRPHPEVAARIAADDKESMLDHAELDRRVDILERRDRGDISTDEASSELGLSVGRTYALLARFRAASRVSCVRRHVSLVSYDTVPARERRDDDRLTTESWEVIMAHVEDVLLWAIAQKGDRYVFGAEVPLTADDSVNWDCSELVEWSCAKAGVTPKVPDGAFNQWVQIKRANGLMTLKDGLRTRGALLFVGDGTGSGRDAITHVAFSLGDGTTIEARGKKWGVGCWTGVGRFNFAGRIAGVDYSRRKVEPGTAREPKVPPFPGTTKLDSRGDAVRQVQQRLRDRGWKIVADGEFGPATDKIVRAFQREKGLTEDGIVGPQTWEKLWRAPIT
jgi:cell wall-associated NlpC family hydrolase